MAGLTGDGRQEGERVAGGCDVVGADVVCALPGGEDLRGERRRPDRVTSLPVSARRKDLRDGDTRTGTPKAAFSSRIPARAASEGPGVLPRK